MRIFCAVRHSIDPRYFYGALWRDNFYPALRKMGHEIIESQVDLLPTSRFMHVASDFTQEEQSVRKRTTEQILDEVRTVHAQQPVDLFLSYFYNAHFDSEGFDELQRLGIPSTNFYCNSIYQFPLVASIAAKVDYSWHAERDARSSYLSVGANPIWVQMGADPNVYFSMPKIARKPKAVFVGQRYADRDRWVAALVRAGVPIDIYGTGWRTEHKTCLDIENQETVYLGRKSTLPGSWSSYRRLISKEVRDSGFIKGMSRIKSQIAYRQETKIINGLLQPHTKGRAPNVTSIFASYELCVNFNNVWADGRSGSLLIPHVRLRDFEGPMCRTCYLTGYTDEIAEFYKLGEEIDTYRSTEELIDKIRFYLSHPSEAERLRDAGHKRALRDHTWERRFEKLFRDIGLKK